MLVVDSFYVCLDRGYNFIIICHVIHRGNYIPDIKSISLLKGEYGKPIYRYDRYLLSCVWKMSNTPQ